MEKSEGIRLDTRRYSAEPAEVPKGTLVEAMYAGIDRGKADALRRHVGGEWRVLSHGEIEERVRRLGCYLTAAGIERGDCVAILSENRPEWAISDYAILCMGGQTVPIYTTLPADQIAYVLRDSGARLIFVSTPEQLAKVEEVRADLPALREVVVFDDPGAVSAPATTLAEALERGGRDDCLRSPEEFRRSALAAQPDDVATLIYTSGTTGDPKGVMLTHDNIHSNTIAVQRELSFQHTDVALSFLPLSHIFERMVDYCLFSRGVTIAYVEAFDRVGAAMAEVRPTIVVSTPRVYEKLYARVMSATGVKRRLVRWSADVAKRWARARLGGTDVGAGLRAQRALADRLVFRKLRDRIGGRLRFFVSGGAPLNIELAYFFFGAGILILEGYGLTETSPVTNVNTPTSMKVGTVGKPIPGTEIRIADDGEILVRGPQVMKGYYGKPEATAEVIDEDGWFHTGDIGELDLEGYLRITDRKKDLIVTAGGKNISPQPIENLAKSNRYISEAVMIGDRRPYAVMLLVPDFDALRGWAAHAGVSAAGDEELVQNLATRRKMEKELFGTLAGLARFETPKKIALLSHEFSIEAGELTPSLKVKRRVVEERYRAIIDSLYEGADTVDSLV